MVFYDRRDAGRQLGRVLRDRLAGGEAGIVMGVTPGGAVVAAEVARILQLPLDLVIVRRIGVPGDAELAIGAVGEDGHAMTDEAPIKLRRIPAAYLSDSINAARAAVHERVRPHRRGGTSDLRGKTAVLIDDGIATTESMAAAIRTVRRSQASRVYAAAPVAAAEAVTRLSRIADGVTVLDMPFLFFAASQAYVSFPQVSDEEVRALVGGPDRIPA